MNLFDKAKYVESKNTEKRCINCKKIIFPDPRNVKRGWGLHCSKSCAACTRYKYNKMSKEERIREKRDDKLSSIGI